MKSLEQIRRDEATLASREKPRTLYAIHVRYLADHGRRERLTPWYVESVCNDRGYAQVCARALRAFDGSMRTRVRKVKPGADPWAVSS